MTLKQRLELDFLTLQHFYLVLHAGLFRLPLINLFLQGKRLVQPTLSTTCRGLLKYIPDIIMRDNYLIS